MIYQELIKTEEHALLKESPLFDNVMWDSTKGIESFWVKKWKDLYRDFFGMTPRKNQPAVYILGEFYVGCTANLDRRIRQHVSCALNRPTQLVNFEVRRRLAYGEFIGLRILIPDNNYDTESLFIKIYRDSGVELLNVDA